MNRSLVRRTRRLVPLIVFAVLAGCSTGSDDDASSATTTTQQITDSSAPISSGLDVPGDSICDLATAEDFAAAGFVLPLTEEAAMYKAVPQGGALEDLMVPRCYLTFTAGTTSQSAIYDRWPAEYQPLPSVDGEAQVEDLPGVGDAARIEHVAVSDQNIIYVQVGGVVVVLNVPASAGSRDAAIALSKVMAERI